MKVENIFVVNGDFIMGNNQKIGDISNNTFGDNVNLQGDNVSQTKNSIPDEFNKAYDDLIIDIQNLSDESQKEQAEFYANQLKIAAEKDDKITVKQMVKFLGGFLGTASSLITIGSLF